MSSDNSVAVCAWCKIEGEVEKERESEGASQTSPEKKEREILLTSSPAMGWLVAMKRERESLVECVWDIAIGLSRRDPPRLKGSQRFATSPVMAQSEDIQNWTQRSNRNCV